MSLHALILVVNWIWHELVVLLERFFFQHTTSLFFMFPMNAAVLIVLFCFDVRSRSKSRLSLATVCAFAQMQALFSSSLAESITKLLAYPASHPIQTLFLGYFLFHHRHWFLSVQNKPRSFRFCHCVEDQEQQRFTRTALRCFLRGFSWK